MIQPTERRWCFATLALGKPYREMAKLLASDLAVHAPGRRLVIATDAPEDFKDHPNVSSFEQQRVGLYTCYSDRRFLIGHALNDFDEVVHIDSDTRISRKIPGRVATEAQIATLYAPVLSEQVQKFLLPRNGRAVLNAARAFGVDPDKTKFIKESIYSVKTDGGREKIFLQIWDIVTRLFDFQGVSITDGFCMSIAAAVAGWTPSDAGLELFAECLSHDEVSRHRHNKSSISRAVQRAVNYSQLQAHRRKVIKSIRTSLDSSSS